MYEILLCVQDLPCQEIQHLEQPSTSLHQPDQPTAPPPPLPAQPQADADQPPSQFDQREAEANQLKSTSSKLNYEYSNPTFVCSNCHHENMLNTEESENVVKAHFVKKSHVFRLFML